MVELATDSTGLKLATAAGPSPNGAVGVFTSVNGGVTWTNSTPVIPDAGGNEAGWTSIASDSTGQHLVAVSLIQGGNLTASNLWTSSNGGQAWICKLTPTSRP